MHIRDKTQAIQLLRSRYTPNSCAVEATLPENHSASVLARISPSADNAPLLLDHSLHGCCLQPLLRLRSTTRLPIPHEGVRETPSLLPKLIQTQASKISTSQHLRGATLQGLCHPGAGSAFLPERASVGRQGKMETLSFTLVPFFFPPKYSELKQEKTNGLRSQASLLWETG